MTRTDERSHPPPPRPPTPPQRLTDHRNSGSPTPGTPALSNRHIHAEGIESLWANSAALLEDPPAVKNYQPGTWGPNAIHQLIAPNAWRLPFERGWREAKKK